MDAATLPRMRPDVVALSDTLELLARLHRHKNAAYGDAWRKRGEIIAIFANLARKYDRLVIGMSEREPASTDPLADTIGDLCVYAAKYLTWLAETQPDAFNVHHGALDASTASAQRGPAAVESIFAALTSEPTLAGPAPDDRAQGWAQVEHSFTGLETGLMAQAEPEAPPDTLLSWSQKVELAWALTAASGWLLTLLATEAPSRLDGLREEVATMDTQARQ